MESLLNKQKPWYSNSYRRNLVDMHIPEWDVSFMSQFDPDRYVELLKIAHVDTALVYANSCLGICNWPTEVSHMHRGLGGRNLVGDVAVRLKEAGINFIIYANFWNKTAYDAHPDWRFVSSDGLGTAEYLWDPGRYGVCCFNTPYRKFMLDQIEELAVNYEFAGMWIDMIHWPYSPCYCHGCRARYKQEQDADLPRVVDWSDPQWIRFQQTREKWLAEFTEEITNTIKRHKPNASVGHQCASWATGWQNGLTNDFFKQCDYVSGDFYGDALQQTFTCKALYHLSEHSPFEFMTSRCPDLTDHTTSKSKEMLRAQTFSAITNGGAFLFIDAIDPKGTQNEKVYRTMGDIYREVEAYEPYLDSDAVAVRDVAIYINFESLIDLGDNGNSVLSGSLEKPLIRSAMNAAGSLLDANIQFGVITKKNLQELNRFSVIVLPNLLRLDDEEIEAIRAFVRDGGGIYASHDTSLYDKSGNKRPDFGLSDVFGLSYAGVTEEEITYMAPTEHAASFFPEHSADYPVAITSSQARVRLHEGSRSEVLATLTLPYFNPKNPNRFASAISNPPGIATEEPSLVLNRYGKGMSLYCAGEFEKMKGDDHKKAFVQLIGLVRGSRFTLESDAPKPVELALYRNRGGSLSLRMLNFQSELPNIPVEGLSVAIKWEGTETQAPGRVVLLPEEKPLHFEMSEGYIQFNVPRLDTFAMLLIGD
ncbi:alpha-amylase family protein [Cohnella silvisoli]|uniref:Alpha-L-fucosidase n=1 Tax=Cohnella silvisoli TaxID=2873699 RepID=A0ABV1KS81_9BACL|nr:alpha-amylase family protein [Cohnella silvisoli]MCD9022449.1 alpha-L-fucosidase [Cohnella silvisoli]